MNPDNKTKQSNQAQLHPMVVLQPGERVICDIKRHPFGIVSMYVAAVFALVIMTALAVMSPSIFSQYGSTGGSDFTTFVQAGAVIFGVLIILVLFIATTVYWQNRWIVTDDSITQITQASLFGRRVSQLSMENLEDITIDQDGILQTMFNFGTLRAETAGERSKFAFQYCPDPKKYARAILEVHEAFIHQIRHQPQAVNPVTPINGPDYGQTPVAPQYAQQPQPPQYQQGYAPQQQQSSPTQQQWGSPMPPAPYQQPGQPAPQQPVNGQYYPEQDQNSNRTTLPPPLQ